MFRAQKKKTRLHTGLTRGLALLLCSLMLIISFQFGDSLIFAEAADNETVTVTVNYVYESNQAMVAQPYTAQIMKGSAFKKTLEVPKLVNYSIPTDLATGLSDRIVLSRDEAAGVYSLAFDLSSVDEDITVNLYYKAGTAKYMVYHYFQNLEDDANSGVEIMDYIESAPEEETIEEEAIPFQLVEEKPSFNGGDANEFSKWVNSRLVYPEIAKENGVQGRVTLQFTVNADGSVSNVKVLRGVDSSLDKEAVRVVSSSPKWKPGKQRDRAVKVTYTFPVIFQLR